MENQVNLEEVTDIKELKCMKADQYDVLEGAQRQVQQSNQNIGMINARIAQLEQENSKTAAEAAAHEEPPAEQ